MLQVRTLARNYPFSASEAVAYISGEEEFTCMQLLRTGGGGRRRDRLDPVGGGAAHVSPGRRQGCEERVGRELLAKLGDAAGAPRVTPHVVLLLVRLRHQRTGVAVAHDVVQAAENRAPLRHRRARTARSSLQGGAMGKGLLLSGQADETGYSSTGK